MQVEAGGRVYVLWRQRAALGVVHEHDAAPVLLWIGRLLLAEELRRRLRRVIVLAHVDRLAWFLLWIAHQHEDVREAEHVAVDEETPALIPGEVRYEEPRHREFG